jgi:hypothetical protein
MDTAGAGDVGRIGSAANQRQPKGDVMPMLIGFAVLIILIVVVVRFLQK